MAVIDFAVTIASRAQHTTHQINIIRRSLCSTTVMGLIALLPTISVDIVDHSGSSGPSSLHLFSPLRLSLSILWRFIFYCHES